MQEIVKKIDEQEPEAISIVRHLRTFCDWISRIDFVRVIVMAAVVCVERMSLASTSALTGPEKLNIAVEVLRQRIGAGGWFGLFANLVLKILVSFAVSEMNSRYGKDWS